MDNPLILPEDIHSPNVCACVYVYVTCACHGGIHVEVREKLAGVSSSLPSCKSHQLNPGHQARNFTYQATLLVHTAVPAKTMEVFLFFFYILFYGCSAYISARPPYA